MPNPVIYVDRLRPAPKKGNWAHVAACHMFTDPGHIECLHAFAREIGLRQCWFHSAGAMPHYDLNPRMRAIAIQAGAIEKTLRETAECVRSWRMSDYRSSSFSFRCRRL